MTSQYPANRIFVSDGDRLRTTEVTFMKSFDSGTKKGTGPVGHYSSEKLDGLRFCWDGKYFISTGGNVPFYIPGFIEDIMPPSIPLDGEIWSGRDGFNSVNGIFNVKPGKGKTYTEQQLIIKWMSITINVFDIFPYDKEHNIEYYKRYELLKEIVADRIKHWKEIKDKWMTEYTNKGWKDVIDAFIDTKCPLVLVEQELVHDMESFGEKLMGVLSKGGEGLIVRNPMSLYISGRSANSIKYKQMEDGECTVISILPGTGRLDRSVVDNEGKSYMVMGSLMCHLTDDVGNVLIGNSGLPISFKLGGGFSDEARENYWNPLSTHYIFNTVTNKSAVITFKCMKLNGDSGVPREPRFYRIRIPPSSSSITSAPVLLADSISVAPVTDKESTALTIEEMKEEIIRLEQELNDVKQKRVIDTLSIVIMMLQLELPNSIERKKRVDAYETTINMIKMSGIEETLKSTTPSMTTKIMSIVNNGYLKLEMKTPYNGALITNGQLVDTDGKWTKLNAFIDMYPIIKSKVGLGVEKVKGLIDKGYASIDDLEKQYMLDFTITKACKEMLGKYFEGRYVKGKGGFLREEVRYYKDIIFDIAKKYKPPGVRVCVAGSYSRKAPIVGDLDIVIGGEDNTILNKFVSTLKQSLVDKGLVCDEDGDERGNNIWLKKDEDSRPIKLELYIYVMKSCNFIFAMMARSLTVDENKRLRTLAITKDLKLNEYGIWKNGSLLESGSNVIIESIGKDYFETQDDVKLFLEQ